MYFLVALQFPPSPGLVNSSICRLNMPFNTQQAVACSFPLLGLASEEGFVRSSWKSMLDGNGSGLSEVCRKCWVSSRAGKLGRQYLSKDFHFYNVILLKCSTKARVMLLRVSSSFSFTYTWFGFWILGFLLLQD